MLRRFTPAFPPTTPTCTLRALAHTQSFLAPQRRPLEFKVAFSPTDYAKLYKAMPEWDEDLARADFNTIDAKLVAAGFPPLQTPKMAQPLTCSPRSTARRVVASRCLGCTEVSATRSSRRGTTCRPSR